eukprot:CAMPEP_0179293762 /NCGR_PEP_ID=MMETSP0797-20121207/43542_1 /TAXON_ID=47934 /ORGANISM="Dinophysis acuminata, Strain DAEP01" /LENGTH=167 /DNA_ID=CAMNT_0021002923 /DNA_START=225 /DNA_END=726 /DNA_ORIENTATION=-
MLLAKGYVLHDVIRLVDRDQQRLRRGAPPGRLRRAPVPVDEGYANERLAQGQPVAKLSGLPGQGRERPVAAVDDGDGGDVPVRDAPSEEADRDGAEGHDHLAGRAPERAGRAAAQHHEGDEGHLRAPRPGHEEQHRAHHHDDRPQVRPGGAFVLVPRVHAGRGARDD